MPIQPPPKLFGPPVNRIADVLAHLDRYAFRGVTRLAADARVSSSSVSRVIAGKMNPSFLMIARLTAALERAMGRHLDPREIFSESGEFPTRSCCELVGCRGCLPELARDEWGELKPAFRGVRPGTWVTSRHPKGYGAGGRE